MTAAIDLRPYRKHGTYRPSLSKLVASNNAADVREATKTGFAVYEADNNDFAKAITTLAKLKGIGPATASLLLSCYDPMKVPFFSDELYRYLHFEEAKTKGWDRKISYSAKEYKSLFEKTQTLRERLSMASDSKRPRTSSTSSQASISALEIEKLAYVLGKQATKSQIPPPSPPHASAQDDNRETQQPPPKRRKVAQRSSDNDDYIDPVQLCRRKGLKGSPTYDRLGFELDKEYIIKYTGGRPRPLSDKALDRFSQQDKDKERKAEILGLSIKGVHGTMETAWDDRVARDLGMAFHEVGMEEYEMWGRRGFKVNKEDFENLGEEERERLSNLMQGSALRKGSKHR